MKINNMINDIELVNAVGGGSLGSELDLPNLYQDIPLTTNYEPEQHPGLYFKIPDTGVTVMLFRTGEYHLTGGKSIDALQETKDRIISTLSATIGDIDDENVTFEVRNLVYTANIGYEIDLSALAIDIGLGLIEYEPEQSPALFYSPSDFQGTFFIFRTGKIILVGCDTKKSCKKSFEHLNETLQSLSNYPPTN